MKVYFMEPCLLKRWLPVWFCLVAFALFLGLSFALLSPSHLKAYSAENALIEDLTAAFLFVGGFVGLLFWWRERREIWLLYSFLMVMGGLREMDAHKAWTTMSIFKSRFYLSENVPLFEKICGAVIIVLLLLAIGRLLRYAMPALKRLWHGELITLIFFTGCGFWLMAKSLDSFFRTFPSLVAWQEAYGIYFVYAEESLEMVGALLFLMLPYLFWRARRAS